MDSKPRIILASCNIAIDYHGAFVYLRAGKSVCRPPRGIAYQLKSTSADRDKGLSYVRNTVAPFSHHHDPHCEARSPESASIMENQTVSYKLFLNISILVSGLPYPS